MPSRGHETLVEMFRYRPALAPELLADVLGVAVPAHRRARVESGDHADLNPTEYRADAVVVLDGDHGPVLAVVVEVQLRRDSAKWWSWPVYLATLRARLRCPAVLLVICVDDATAAWCATPIELGPGARMVPTVLGPERVPVVDRAEDAGRTPELAVLSALAHADGPAGDEVLGALLGALSALDQEHSTLYSDLVLAALPAAARHHLEALMASPTFEYQSEFVRRYVFQGRAEGRVEGRVEGRAEGEAKAVLTVLDARGIAIPDDTRARISECTDLDQLDSWVRRAVTARSVEDLFV